MYNMYTNIDIYTHIYILKQKFTTPTPIVSFMYVYTYICKCIAICYGPTLGKDVRLQFIQYAHVSTTTKTIANFINTYTFTHIHMYGMYVCVWLYGFIFVRTMCYATSTAFKLEPVFILTNTLTACHLLPYLLLVLLLSACNLTHSGGFNWAETETEVATARR